uniref:Uncharacterized protein n=1 Tax=Arundo donax TaxID=35708 RepID=A0A0A8YKD1_ARUDO
MQKRKRKTISREIKLSDGGSGQVLGPQKERNISARTGSSAAALPLACAAAAAALAALRDESAGALLGPHAAADEAASLASPAATRLITILRLISSP